jgi:hypothetical protein
MDRMKDPETGAELDPRVRDLLRRLPVPPPSPGFAARLFARLQPRPRRVPVPVMAALAASLTLGVGLAVWLDQAAAPATGVATLRIVELAPNEVSAVRLVFRSPRALNGVTIALRLPEGVELAGRPGRRELSWQADLHAGANLLELPVIVQPGAGGVITAHMDYGQDHREFAVRVQPKTKGVSGTTMEMTHA